MKEFKVGNIKIGEGNPCFVIGEIGLNHNGSVEIAKQLIDVCKEAGCDAVKFQKRNVAELAIKEVLDAEDNRFPEFGKTYREIREYLEFNKEEHLELMEYAHQKNIMFFSTPFDIVSAEFLDDLNIPMFKIASHSVTNLPLIRKLAEIGKPVIMSTGMCNYEELDRSVKILKDAGVPLTILHCVSSYPTPFDEVNLKQMDALRERYQVPIGYSGHEVGYLPTLIAVGRGANAVERHITLDNNMNGFDHKLSVNPEDLKTMITDIRHVEMMFGDGEKFVREKEKVTRSKYHVSIVVTRNVEAGEVISNDMITFKNPGTGLPPSMLNEVLNKKVLTNIKADTLLSMDQLES